MKKICIVGRFGDGLNGQTIKTKTISAQLAKIYGQDQILEIDTFGGVKKLFSLPLTMKRVLKECENIVILPAHKGVRVIAPSLVFWNKKYHRSLHYAVVGGWLPDFLKNKKGLAKNLRKFDKLYVETQSMLDSLNAQGFGNVCVMPNCKELNVLTSEQLVTQEKPPYKLCTFSRVTPTKGIEDAINAVKIANEKIGECAFTLDIFGQVADTDKEWFEGVQAKMPEYVKYGGKIPFDKSTEIIKEYFALLFPTFYPGEGFAGTLIDSYSAGVPVIASDWRYNSELVEEGVTGFILKPNEPEIWAAKLVKAYQNPSTLTSLKQNCIERALSYDAQNTIKIMTSEIDK